MLLFGLLSCELCFIAGPRSYGILEFVFPRRVAFQHVLFLHQIYIFMSVAVTRVVPVLFPSPSTKDDVAQGRVMIEMLHKLAIVADGESM